MLTYICYYYLRYIYTEYIEVRTDNVHRLIYASEKYTFPAITNECKKFLTACINVDNACVVLTTAYTFQLEDLQEDALQFIFDNGEFCLKSNSFLNLSSGCVKLIIESWKLLCSEGIVYENLIQWAQQQCKKEQHVTANDEPHVTDEQLRKVLGDLIYLIRFPIMERKYFSHEVSTKNVLTKDERLEIYQSFDGISGIDTFPGNMRLYNAKLVWRCKVNLRRQNVWKHDGADDCLDFTLSYDCDIYGILVYGSKQYSEQHYVKISILNGSTILGSAFTKLTSVPEKNVYPIYLPEPLRILANSTYTIKLNMKGGSCFCGKNYKTEVKRDDDACVTFTNSSSSPNGTNITSGQIPAIILSRA